MQYICTGKQKRRNTLEDNLSALFKPATAKIHKTKIVKKNNGNVTETIIINFMVLLTLGS